jgi:hypothetical protein
MAIAWAEAQVSSLRISASFAGAMRVVLAAAVSAFLVALAASGGAQARPGPKPAAPASPTLSAGVAQRLSSGDEAQIKSALDEARLSGKGAVKLVPGIVKDLSAGLPYGLAQAAIETLGDVAQDAGDAPGARRAEFDAASEAIAVYLRHRSVTLRRAAAKALVQTKGAAAVKGLRAALSDEDAQVRGVAATGLGALKAKDAVGDLFVALDHRIQEAAASIGQLCNPDECEALVTRMGKIPFDVLTSGLDPILFRPATEVSDDAKVKLVTRVRELGTGEANRFLRDVQKRWPAAWSSRIKQSIDQGVQATSASPGSAAGGP